MPVDVGGVDSVTEVEVVELHIPFVSVQNLVGLDVPHDILVQLLMVHPPAVLHGLVAEENYLLVGGEVHEADAHVLAHALVVELHLGGELVEVFSGEEAVLGRAFDVGMNLADEILVAGVLGVALGDQGDDDFLVGG